MLKVKSTVRVIVLRTHNEHHYRILMDFGKIADTYYPHFIVEHDDSHKNHSREKFSRVKFSRVKFSIDMRIIEGEVPVGITQEIMSWARSHYSELEENWLNLIEEEISSKFRRKKNNLNAA